MTNGETERSTTLYHCAEGVSTDNSVLAICSSEGASRWSTDPSSHGCISASSGTAGII